MTFFICKNLPLILMMMVTIEIKFDNDNSDDDEKNMAITHDKWSGRI